MKKECKHKNKEIEIHETLFFCADCKEWVGIEPNVK